ncbi:MAG: YqjF family protein [Gemmatimonadales bacterium]
MLQYEVEPGLLQPLVPRGTELDRWNGRTLVSIVGFRFLDTRILGAPIPLHRDFDEVNLRFYVRRRDAGAWRRAVVFVREIVPRRAIALVARLWYNEPYIALPMRHMIDMDRAEQGEAGRVTYEWRRNGEWEGLQVETGGYGMCPTAGSEEEFVSEHYWGYTIQRDGGSLEYEVTHPPWRVWAATRAEFRCDAGPLYGLGFGRVLEVPPRSAFVADGSAVAVYRGRRLPP